MMKHLSKRVTGNINRGCGLWSHKSEPSSDTFQFDETKYCGIKNTIVLNACILMHKNVKSLGMPTLYFKMTCS